MKNIQLAIEGVLLLISVSIIIVYTLEHNKNKILNKQMKVLHDLTESLNPHRKFEDNLTSFLKKISTLITAYSYGIFIFDAKKDNYILKSIRQVSEDGFDIGPAYSGLVPYKKETFKLPPMLPKDITPENPSIIRKGEVPLLIIPLKEGEGLITIGPIKSIPRQTMGLLKRINDEISNIFDAIIKAEELKKQINLVVSSKKAVKNISNIFSSNQSMIDLVLEVAKKTLSSNSYFFMSIEENASNIMQLSGFDQATEGYLLEDKKLCFILEEALDKREYTVIKKGDRAYFDIPDYLIASGLDMMVIVNVKSRGGRGIIGFCHNEVMELREYHIKIALLMAKRVEDIINSHFAFKEYSSSYVDILKLLEQLIDNIKPETVGYSELMSRFSAIIAKKMGLSHGEIKNISIAAYLSNIGIIGLSDNVLNKTGKYTELEYEIMKLHSDAGASIIDATIGNDEIASYIRYHHERIDGLGYPYGIMGENIPVGARILAVTQTFLAKLLPRGYRSGLSFEETILQLKAAAGTHLDSAAVDALITWFERKQQELGSEEKGLGPCWEMRCSPQNVCMSCDAYRNGDNKCCWKAKKNNCKAHGNNCASCFIYTEYLYRISNKKL